MSKDDRLTQWQEIEAATLDETVSEEEQAFRIGRRDGYSEAVQHIDMLTGGDGEYRYCLGLEDDERHCPDPDTMIARIATRLEALQAQPRTYPDDGLKEPIHEFRNLAAEAIKESFAALTASPPVVEREAIARIIDPSAAELFDNPGREIYGDSYAYNVWQNGGKGDWQTALTKADAILALTPVEGVGENFQARVAGWMQQCFGPEIAADKLERNDRFIEESLELVQSLGYSQDRAHALVDYVFGRPIGEPSQEVGAVMVTLAALCEPSSIDLTDAAETELARILQPEIVAKIRAKQAAKPTGSALPISTPVAQGDEVRAALEPCKTEYGWLIELDGPQGLSYCIGSKFDPDHAKALRFARREDAQAFCDQLSIAHTRIAEHGWD